MPELELPRGAACEPGLVVVDKPTGLTSNQVLSRIRRLSGQRKVGYAGTLDPMATGVLIFAIGKATKLLQYLTAHDKAYLARIRFGIETDTDDAEGAVVAAAGAGGLTAEKVEATLGNYRGEIQQVPSTYSAIKVRGQRAYDLARRGEEVELKARKVTVSRLELLPKWPVPIGKNLPTGTGHFGKYGETLDLNLLVECSAGTYIRALARDLGRDLGTGAHLTALRRTRVGKYSLEQAKTLAELAVEVEREGKIRVITLTEALLETFPSLEINETQTRALSFGQPISVARPPQLEDNGGKGKLFTALTPKGQAAALLEMTSNSAQTPRDATDSLGDSTANRETLLAKPVWVLLPSGSPNG